MKFFSAIFMAFLFSMAILSCHPLPSLPEDEATPEERATIEKTVTYLTQLFKENGYKGSFDKMPILVSSEDPAETGWAGRCENIGVAAGRYIVLTRQLFEQDLKDDTKSQVTSALLHEIGHCYFARHHEHELISSPEYAITVEYAGERGGNQGLVDGIPASIMYITSGEQKYSSIVTSNRELQTYYVRELLGLERLRNMNDLSKFKSVRALKKSED